MPFGCGNETCSSWRGLGPGRGDWLWGNRVLASGRPARPYTIPPGPRGKPATIVARVEASFRGIWSEQGLVPASPAPELAVFRRLSLVSLRHGPIARGDPPVRGPAASGPDRLLARRPARDRRFADYLAERFARAYVGTEDGPFLLFRRRRFVAWLSDALLENRPYDALVRDLIAERDSGPISPRPTSSPSRSTRKPAARPRSAGRAGCAGVLGCPASTPPSATTTRSSPGSRTTFAALPRSLAAFTPTCAASATMKMTTSRPTTRPRNRSRSSPASRFARAVAGDRDSARRLAAWITDPAEPEFRPRHGQSRLGLAVRPAAGRAGRRPAVPPASFIRL